MGILGKRFDVEIKERIKELEQLFYDYNKSTQTQEKLTKAQIKKAKLEESNHPKHHHIQTLKIKHQQRKIEKTEKKSEKYRNAKNEFIAQKKSFIQFLFDRKSYNTIEDYINYIQYKIQNQALVENIMQDMKIKWAWENPKNKPSQKPMKTNDAACASKTSKYPQPFVNNTVPDYLKAKTPNTETSNHQKVIYTESINKIPQHTPRSKPLHIKDYINQNTRIKNELSSLMQDEEVFKTLQKEQSKITRQLKERREEFEKIKAELAKNRELEQNQVLLADMKATLLSMSRNKQQFEIKCGTHYGKIDEKRKFIEQLLLEGIDRQELDPDSLASLKTMCTREAESLRKVLRLPNNKTKIDTNQPTSKQRQSTKPHLGFDIFPNYNMVIQEFFNQRHFCLHPFKQKELDFNFNDTKLLQRNIFPIFCELIKLVNKIPNCILDKTQNLHFFFEKDFYKTLLPQIKLHIPKHILSIIHSFKPIWLHYFENSQGERLFLGMFNVSHFINPDKLIIISSTANIDSFIPIVKKYANDCSFYIDHNDLGSEFLQTFAMWTGATIDNIKIKNNYVAIQKHFISMDFIQQKCHFDQSKGIVNLIKQLGQKLFEDAQNSDLILDSELDFNLSSTLQLYAEGVHPLFINYWMEQVIKHGTCFIKPSFEKTDSNERLHNHSSYAILPSKLYPFFINPHSIQQSKLTLIQLDYNNKENNSISYYLDPNPPHDPKKHLFLACPVPNTDFPLKLISHKSHRIELKNAQFFCQLMQKGTIALLTDKFFFGSYRQINEQQAHKTILPLQYWPINKYEIIDINKSFFFQSLDLFNSSSLFTCFYPLLFIINNSSKPYRSLFNQIYFILRETIYRLRDQINFYSKYTDSKGCVQNNGFYLNNTHPNNRNQWNNVFYNYFSYYQLDLIEQLKRLKITIYPLLQMDDRYLFYINPWNENYYKNNLERFATHQDWENQFMILMDGKPLIDRTNSHGDIINTSQEQIVAVRENIRSFTLEIHKKLGLIRKVLQQTESISQSTQSTNQQQTHHKTTPQDQNPLQNNRLIHVPLQHTHQPKPKSHTQNSNSLIIENQTNKFQNPQSQNRQNNTNHSQQFTEYNHKALHLQKSKTQSSCNITIVRDDTTMHIKKSLYNPR